MKRKMEDSSNKDNDPTPAEKKNKISRLRDHRAFSLKYLLTFVLIFGAIGGYILWRSLAATTTVPVTNAGRASVFISQNYNGSENVTQAQAVNIAKAFNVVEGLSGVYDNYVSAMKSANPKLLLVAYLKGGFINDSSLTESAYSHNASGGRIRSIQFGTYLINPFSTAASNYTVNNCLQTMQRSGYDGCMLDTVGTAALNLSFATSLAINPQTGKVFTDSEWLNAMSNHISRIVSGTGKPILANGLRNGRSYFNDPSKVLLSSGMLGALAESWLRGGSDSITNFPSETVWKQDIDMIVDAESQGKSFIGCTKVWTSGTQAQKDAWYKYATASFLMGNGGHSYYQFTYASGDSGVVYPLANLDLGTASGSYAKVNNVYQRSFSGGRVFVNPTANTYTISLGGTYYKLDGSAVTSLTLGPNGSEILKSGSSSSGDTTAPTVNMTAPTNGSTVSLTQNVSANASDNVGVVGVQFKLDGNNLGTEYTTSPYSFNWDTITVANGAHTLAAVARDAAGNTKSSSVSITVQNDTTAPTAPVNLRSPSHTSSTIDLAWNASTDDVGVTSYEIWRGDASSANFLKVGSVDGSTTTYTDSGLTANVTYSYYIKAFDAVGHASAPSNTLLVTASSTTSVVKVFAYGTSQAGVYPVANLYISGNLVASYTVTSTARIYSYTAAATVTHGQVKITYQNDKSSRDLFVDKINIDGVDYQTEAASVYSQGHWTPSTKCASGYLQTEEIDCPGYIQY